MYTGVVVSICPFFPGAFVCVFCSFAGAVVRKVSTYSVLQSSHVV